jgi:hypothetical protein
MLAAGTVRGAEKGIDSSVLGGTNTGRGRGRGGASSSIKLGMGSGISITAFGPGREGAVLLSVAFAVAAAIAAWFQLAWETCAWPRSWSLLKPSSAIGGEKANPLATAGTDSGGRSGGNTVVSTIGEGGMKLIAGGAGGGSKPTGAAKGSCVRGGEAGKAEAGMPFGELAAMGAEAKEEAGPDGWFIVGMAKGDAELAGMEANGEPVGGAAKEDDAAGGIIVSGLAGGEARKGEPPAGAEGDSAEAAAAKATGGGDAGFVAKAEPGGGSIRIMPPAIPVEGEDSPNPRFARLGNGDVEPAPASAECNSSAGKRIEKSRLAVLSTLRKPTSVTPSMSPPSSVIGIGLAAHSLTVAVGSAVVIQVGTIIGSKPNSAAE